MNEQFLWTGGLRPVVVTVSRKGGLDLLPGEWEASVVHLSPPTKVIVRECELEPIVDELGGVA